MGRSRGGGSGRGMSRGGGGGGESEMVERIVKDVGDVVEGKRTWKDLLRGFVDDAGTGGAGSGSSDNGRARKRRG